MKLTPAQFEALPSRQEKLFFKPGFYRDREHPGYVFEIRNFYDQSLKNPVWTTLRVDLTQR